MADIKLSLVKPTPPPIITKAKTDKALGNRATKKNEKATTAAENLKYCLSPFNILVNLSKLLETIISDKTPKKSGKIYSKKSSFRRKNKIAFRRFCAARLA